MPTLAAKNSQATIANMATAATSTATTATATAINFGGSEQCDGDVVTATRIATPSDTQNSGGALNHHHHHYHHPPAPHGGSPAVGNVLSTMMAPATATTTTAVAATNTVAASLATFNGNSNLNIANGNIGGNSNHNNSHNHSHTTHAGAGGSGGGVGKKSLTNMHASREDVASPQPQAQLPPPPLTQLGNVMPTTSINNQQLSATGSQSNHNHNNNNTSSNMNGSNGSSNNNSNGNGNGSANISSILKGSKENLLQNSYNGAPTSDNIVLDIDDPGDGLGPLPPKWETAYTERGELYFIDHNTGTSHWLDPRLSKFQKKSLEDCGDDELPYGWEKIEDSLYGTYYIDHVNRRTQYENPVLEAKRRAAEQRQKQLQQPPPPAHSSAQNMQGVGYTTQQQQPPPPPPTSQQSQQQQQQLRPQTPSTQMTSNLVNGAGMCGNVMGGADDGNDRVTPALGNNMVDISQRGMQPPPAGAVLQTAPTPLLPYKFTRNPGEMQGERITASLVKSARGLGITIVGGDDGAEEFLQIKSIVPHGPAWLDGQLQMGDVLVYVNDTCVLGFTHHEMVNIFQSILPGETVTLEVCRGYPLPFDPNDPNTEVVTTIAVDGVSVAATDKQRRMLLDLHMDGNYNFLETLGGDGGGTKTHTHNQMRNQHSPVSGGLNDGFILMKKPELQVHTFTIVKGAMGFGFTIADSAYGQKVKKILDYNCCTQLQEGDVLLEINGIDVHQQSHLEVVQILKDCSKTEPTHVKIQRGGASTNSANASPSGGAYNAAVLSNPPPPTSSSSNNSLSNVAKLRKNFTSALFRSKTPTADLYSTQPKEILPIRPKTPLVDTRRTRAQTPNDELQHSEDVNDGNIDGRLSASKNQLDAATHKSTNSLQEIEAISQDIPFLDPYPKLVTSLSERLAGATLLTENAGNNCTNGGNIDNMGGINIGTGYHHASGLSLPSSVADPMRYDHQEYVTAGMRTGGNNIYGISPLPNSMNNFYAPQQLPTPPHLSISASSYSPSTSLGLTTTSATHHNILHHHPLQLPPPPPAPHMHAHPHGSQYSPASLHATTPLQAAHIQNERMQKRVNELLSDRRRVGFSTLDMPQPQKLSPAPYANQQLLQQQQQQQPPSQHSPAVSSVSQQPTLSWLGQTSSNYTNTMQSSPSGNLTYLQRNGGAMDALDELTTEQYELSEVTLERQALGFGFRIVGGTEEGSQVTVGHIVPSGAADNDHRINTGDEILSIDGINVVNSSHHKVVSLMGEAALRGQVTMILRRRLRLTQHQPHLLQPQQQQLPLPPPPPLSMPMRNTYRYPYDVIVSRHESEGFGFVIISSSNQFYGSTIGKLIPGSPADRCGELKVGDRIIAVNRIDISGMSHGDVVNLIKESGLHVRLTIGCPKDALTTPTSTLGTQNSTLLVNSAQVSPGQLSQNQLIYTPLTTQQHKPQISPNLLSNNQNGGNYFMEQPRTSAATTNFVQQQQHTQSPLQQQHQQQQQQQQLLPPQL